MLSSLSKKSYTATLDIAFPPSCLACQSHLIHKQARTFHLLCQECENALKPITPPYCNRCSEPYDGAIDGTFRCANCSTLHYAFDFALAAYRAVDPVRKLIHDLKYHRKLENRSLLAHLLSRIFEDPRLDPKDNWAVVPVPLHPKRQRERHYNQAFEIGRHFARIHKLPLINALQRIHYNTAQTLLNRKQRIHNLKKCITVQEKNLSKLLQKNILLLDDVFTTGATANACAQILKKHGHTKKIAAITIARG